MAILVAGGTKGIGLAVAKAFAREAGDVFLAYHGDDAAAASAAAEAVVDAGGRPHLIKADAGTPEGCAAMAEAVRPVVGRLDQVVHCAVDAYRSTALAADPARFARAVTTNGTSLLFLVQAALPLLLPRQHGVLSNQPRRTHCRAELRRRRRRKGAGGKPDALPCGRTGAERRPDQRHCAGDCRDRRGADPVRRRGGRTGAGRREPQSVRPWCEDADYTSLMRWLASPAAQFIQGQVIFVNGGANLSA